MKLFNFIAGTGIIGLWIAFIYVVNMMAQWGNIDFNWGILPELILLIAIIIGIVIPVIWVIGFTFWVIHKTKN